MFQQVWEKNNRLLPGFWQDGKHWTETRTKFHRVIISTFNFHDQTKNNVLLFPWRTFRTLQLVIEKYFHILYLINNHTRCKVTTFVSLPGGKIMEINRKDIFLNTFNCKMYFSLHYKTYTFFFTLKRLISGSSNIAWTC